MSEFLFSGPIAPTIPRKVPSKSAWARGPPPKSKAPPPLSSSSMGAPAWPSLVPPLSDSFLPTPLVESPTGFAALPTTKARKKIALKSPNRIKVKVENSAQQSTGASGISSIPPSSPNVLGSSIGVNPEATKTQAVDRTKAEDARMRFAQVQEKVEKERMSAGLGRAREITEAGVERTDGGEEKERTRLGDPKKERLGNKPGVKRATKQRSKLNVVPPPGGLDSGVNPNSRPAERRSGARMKTEEARRKAIMKVQERVEKERVNAELEKQFVAEGRERLEIEAQEEQKQSPRPTVALPSGGSGSRIGAISESANRGPVMEYSKKSLKRIAKQQKREKERVEAGVEERGKEKEREDVEGNNREGEEQIHLDEEGRVWLTGLTEDTDSPRQAPEIRVVLSAPPNALSSPSSDVNPEALSTVRQLVISTESEDAKRKPITQEQEGAGAEVEKGTEWTCLDSNETPSETKEELNGNEYLEVDPATVTSLLVDVPKHCPPGLLDLSTLSTPKISKSAPSLTPTQAVENLDYAAHPVLGPGTELSVNPVDGELKSDRDVSLRFMLVCEQKSDSHCPLDTPGLETIGREEQPGTTNPCDNPSAPTRTAVASFSSTLALASPIDDFVRTPYPEGIHGPRAELNANAGHGKFIYDRGFLLQFMSVCKQKPDTLPPLDTIYLQPTAVDLHNKRRSGSGRHRESSVADGSSINPDSPGTEKKRVRAKRPGKAASAGASFLLPTAS